MTEKENQIFEEWKQPIFDAVVRRIDGGESMTANEILTEIKAPYEHRKQLIALVYGLLNTLQRRGVAFAIAAPADHPTKPEMQSRLDNVRAEIRNTPSEELRAGFAAAVRQYRADKNADMAGFYKFMACHSAAELVRRQGYRTEPTTKQLQEISDFVENDNDVS
jgi:hypothetical protein